MPRHQPFEGHSSWSCAFRTVAKHADLEGCRCACHKNEYAQQLESRGFHVHHWKGRLLEAPGLTAKVAIRCATCPMFPPTASHPDVLRD